MKSAEVLFHFEREQQNVKVQKYCSIRKGTTTVPFRKGTAKCENAEVLFHSERNSKMNREKGTAKLTADPKSAIPLENE